jgi:hypothetical protein
MNLVLQASKEVKNNTQLSSGTTSVAYAAIQYIIENMPDYNEQKILIYGLGDIGKNTCKNVLGYTSNKNVTLINRTHERALEFKELHPDITIKNYADLTEQIEDTDILIVSTGAEIHTINKTHLKEGKVLNEAYFIKNGSEEVRKAIRNKVGLVEESSYDPGEHRFAVVVIDGRNDILYGVGRSEYEAILDSREWFSDSGHNEVVRKDVLRGVGRTEKEAILDSLEWMKNSDYDKIVRELSNSRGFVGDLDLIKDPERIEDLVNEYIY